MRAALPQLTTGSQRALPRSPVGAAIPAGVEGPRGRFSRDRLAGARALRPLSGILAAAVMLTACEADQISARAVLEEQGFHAIAFAMAPPVGRPCAWGEPFALRFRAVREDGAVVAGVLCAADESARDARLFADPSEGES